MAPVNGEDPLQYLPPGWTEEKYANATDEDWDNQPDEVLMRNMERMAAQAKLNHTSNMAKIRAEDAARGRPGRRPSYSEDEGEHPLVKYVEDAGWDDFGFMVFRTDFSDDEKWQRFLNQWNELLDEPIESAGPETGLPRLVDKVFMKIVDDDVMSGKGPAEVALAFQMWKEDDDVEPGLDTKMCLVIDAECIASLLDVRSEEDKKAIPPFVKAVDVATPAAGYIDPEYNGVFKVAISSLILDFYPALYTFGHPSELAPFADPVWVSADP